MRLIVFSFLCLYPIYLNCFNFLRFSISDMWYVYLSDPLNGNLSSNIYLLLSSRFSLLPSTGGLVLYFPVSAMYCWISIARVSIPFIIVWMEILLIAFFPYEEIFFMHWQRNLYSFQLKFIKHFTWMILSGKQLNFFQFQLLSSIFYYS